MLELQELYVPIDFSRASRAASALAQSLAEGPKAQVRFVHVVPQILRYASDTLFPYAAMGEDRVHILSELRDNAYGALVRYHELGEVLPKASKAPEPGQHRFEVFTASEGDPIKGILSSRLAESSAQLVVAGVSGEGGARPGGLGACALSLVCDSSRPILLARDVPPDPIKKVVVGLDLSPHTQRVLQAALDLALVCEAVLEAVVVVPEPLEIDVRGILSGAVKVDHKQLVRHARREVGKVLERFFGDLKVPFPYKARYEGMKIERKVWLGDPAAKLVSHVVDSEAQVLVLGTHGERRAQLARRLGRVAQAAGANAPCHVLYIP